MKKSLVQTAAVLSPVETVEIPISYIHRGNLVRLALCEICKGPVNIQWVLFPSLVGNTLLTELFTVADRIAKEIGEKPLDRPAVCGQDDGTGE